MKRHELKTWPEFFDAIWCDKKHFEIRYNDRGFAIGDILRLREHHPHRKEYTGRWMDMYVTWIVASPGMVQDVALAHDRESLRKGWCVMSIKVVFRGERS